MRLGRLFNLFWKWVMAKKINHRGHGGHRELLFSVSSVLSVVFQNPGSQKTIKSLRLGGTLFK
jgi:hypothetical protein